MADEGNRTDHGPTYWDCERIMNDIRSVYPGTAWWEVGSVKVKGEDRYTWYVKCCYRRSGAPLVEAPLATTVAFRGNSGAKTLPSALWHAAFSLLNTLVEAGKTAEQQAMF